MSENVYLDNVDVPPEPANYDEYFLPEGDAVEKAQAATHAVRVKEASLRELYRQLEEKVAEYEFAMGRILKQLKD